MELEVPSTHILLYLICTEFITKVLASLRDTSLAITRLERVVAGDVGVDSAERLATEINQVLFDMKILAMRMTIKIRCSLLCGDLENASWSRSNTSPGWKQCVTSSTLGWTQLCWMRSKERAASWSGCAEFTPA